MSVDLKLNLTGGAWLSDRVFVSDAVRLRSSSPSPSALRQGMSASAFNSAEQVQQVALVLDLKRRK
jgi:hypothetical protein